MAMVRLLSRLQAAEGGIINRYLSLVFCPLFSVSSFLLVALCILVTSFSAAHAQDQSGVVSITSSPAGQPVYVDDLLIGVTPLERYPILAGQRHIRVSHPDQSDWDVRDWIKTVSVTAGTPLQIDIPFVGPVSVSSEPFGASVYLDSAYCGTTPLRLTDLAPGSHTLMIRKDGFETLSRTVTISDTSRQMLSVLLTPETAGPHSSILRSASNTGNTQKWVAYVTLGLGSLFGGLALYTNHQADLSYQRYLNTADPVVLERSFRSASRYDKRSSQYVVIAQVNFAASFYFLIRRAFQRQEPSPEGK